MPARLELWVVRTTRLAAQILTLVVQAVRSVMAMLVAVVVQLEQLVVPGLL